jgi:hypothetical protein
MSNGDEAAQRIWLVLETLAASSPNMLLSDAVPMAQEIWTRVAWSPYTGGVPGPENYTNVPAMASWAAKIPGIERYYPDRKINAIKELRAVTPGMHLKEAKEAIEELFRNPTDYKFPS